MSATASDVENALAIVAHSIVIGVGATAVMDLWAAFLRRCCRVPSLDYALLGRWIGHFPRGRFWHESIGQAAPVRVYGVGLYASAWMWAVLTR